MRISCFFVLDTDPTLCAQSYSDAHLDAVLRLVDRIICTVDSYKQSQFAKNVLCKWAKSDKHYAWLVALAHAIHKEMDYRFWNTSYTPDFSAYRDVPFAVTSPCHSQHFVASLTTTCDINLCLSILIATPTGFGG